jgi:hypothetical protein
MICRISKTNTYADWFQCFWICALVACTWIGHALQSGGAGPPTSAPRDSSTDITSKVREIYRHAAAQVGRMNSYVMRLRRREIVQDRKKAEELILVKFRTEPFSVYLKWLGPEAHGREVVYVKGQYDNLIHTKIAAGDVLLLPAGKRFSLAPDSFLARSNSRHPITEAGFAHLVHQFGDVVEANAENDKHLGTLKYLSTVQRPEFDSPVEGVAQILSPGNDPRFPAGGKRLWYFDTHYHLPVLLISYDERDREVEYYCHDRILFPTALDDDDFNPDKLWGKRQ